MGGSNGALDSAGAADLSLSALLPDEPSSGHRCNANIAESKASINDSLAVDGFDSDVGAMDRQTETSRSGEHGATPK